MLEIKKLLFSATASLLLAEIANAQTNVAVKEGVFSPDWKSLSEWTCPEWFKDAKFGIWAHWGPQCQAEAGDWYARFMYYENSGAFNWHVEHFGEPEEFGLKDLCNAWKAEKWNPEELVALYKSVGARYFFTLGQHHDNFDLWDSPYQEWNSVNVGPKRDIVKEWSDACQKYGLPLGVSMHGSHTWTWMEKSQDYDGNLTKEDGYTLNEDGTEKWWKGLDPQELYAQRHPHSSGWENSGTIHSQWAWGAGASLPSEEYKMKFQNRVLQCINDYKPSMLYFDDTVLPFYGCDDQIGLNILSHFYNSSAEENGGDPQVVVMGKILENMHKQAMLWDVERGIPDRIQDEYWQTCTCIGDWHYNTSTYENNGYKSAQQVVDMLVDVVSKNGNMLLSVPIKGNGTIDEKEQAVLEGIKAWMDINSESVYGTRPWKTFGEGPLAEASNPLTSQGFNEGNNYSSEDVRFVQKDGTVYATIMRWPAGRLFTFESFAPVSKYYSGKVKSVQLLGHGNVEYSFSIDGLTVTLPTEKPNDIAPVFAVIFDNEDTTVSLAEILDMYELRIAELRRQVSYNTGKMSRERINEFASVVEDAKNMLNADEVSQQRALNTVNEAYATLKKNGTNEGGAPSKGYQADITEDILVESGNFSRVNDIGTRFGAPAYWNVENFNIPNGKDGVKNGLDNYPGHDCLMLGVWNDAANSTEGDLSNARIYRTVRLDPGRYYFGAAYNAAYQLSDKAYIFAANTLLDTDEIAEKSLACWNINKSKTNGEFFGIYFTLTEEQDVVLGFQANLLNGSNTQELRADNVVLLSYGQMNYNALEDLIMMTEYAADDCKINDNTGFFNKESVEKLQNALEVARAINMYSSYEEVEKAYNLLNAAYEDFLANGKNKGGAPNEVGCTDVTADYLIEASNFSRADESITTRFASPANWTVENFCIPNGGNGIKNGLDKYPGYDCLSMGVWDDRDNNMEGYLSEARLYRKIHLNAGRYYFGASYNTTYNVNPEAYLFVADNLLCTEEITENSIAYYAINNAPDGAADWHGLYFTLPEAQDVYLGFQMNLEKGSGTQEFRVKEVKLLYYGEINTDKLNVLVRLIEEETSGLTINENTGFYNRNAYEELMAVVVEAKSVGNGATPEEVSDIYNRLTDAFTDFKKNGKNAGGTPDEIGAKDITTEKLSEAENFLRTEDCGTLRFGTPAYWTVENILIDKGPEGVKNGLDKYPGSDCLMLGIWDDRDNNMEGDIADARIYQRIHLDKGRYYFGGQFDALHKLYADYIFVAEDVIPTSEMETQSIAYYNMMDGMIDRNHYGVYFTLDEAKDVAIGIQADMSQGNSTQEVRLRHIMLLEYTGETDGIENVIVKEEKTSAPEFYSLQGIRLKSAPAKGLYIMRQNGKAAVLLAR
ncbi:MAG: alpha-L-fucosidase [Bacteroides sp.]|nr:alpha-L-fucosidase [Roseburia sp.]MCM1345928.1 alpha-L-fucosidase [Bacteroides sp.]MCM1420093.1 alpha-L-fucosidase [Bacteroides sp.]